MKRICFFIGILWSISNLSAQEKVSKKENGTAINEINIELKFAKNIEIKNSVDNQILIEAEVNINENKDNQYFNLNTKKEGQKIMINSDYGDLFTKDKHKITVMNYGSNCVNCKDERKMVVDYVLYIPKNKNLNIKSITGNISITDYIGALSLDLISGNISIKKHSKEMNLKTISGDIDVYVKDAKFKAETLTGTLYSNLNVDFNHSETKGIENKVSGTIESGAANLIMETISGNIFLRKI